MDLWGITYTNIITGEREDYMNTGFLSPERAKDEIRRIMRDAKRYKSFCVDVNELYITGYKIPTPMIGKYWRVKKLKIREA